VAATIRPTTLLAELAALSAELGRDPEQVQAAGGNTSLKEGGVLWVKASGLWLADALARDVFVPVRLAPVLEGIGAGVPDPAGPAVLAEANPGGLRPSIETTLHALLPQAVVVHTHSVRAIALAVREDAEARLAERLAGLAWTFLPYRKPGLPLTLALAERLRAGAPVDVVVLGNHGLVVAAPSVAAARTLLAEVERRIEAPVRLSPPRGGPATDATLAALASSLGLRPARHARVHDLATDPVSLARATAGSLYPDHVIFLGPAAASLTPAAAAATAEEALRFGRKLLLVPGAGSLLPPEAGESADELALCLALALERVPTDARLVYLDPDDEAALLEWDAERYRQSLAEARGIGHPDDRSKAAAALGAGTPTGPGRSRRG
jgi:rhamnose utilization protein RhaD (predicted bifunctional aldolase and dehydrogenase)